MVAVAPAGSGRHWGQAGMLMVHPMRHVTARRMTISPVACRAAAVIISCHGRLILNPPASVHSRPHHGSVLSGTAIGVGSGSCGGCWTRVPRVADREQEAGLEREREPGRKR